MKIKATTIILTGLQRNQSRRLPSQIFLEGAWSVITKGHRIPCKYFVGIGRAWDGSMRNGFSCELEGKSIYDKELVRCSPDCYFYQPYEPSMLKNGFCWLPQGMVYHVMGYIHSMRLGQTLCARLVDAREGVEIIGSGNEIDEAEICSFCLARLRHPEEYWRPRGEGA